MGLRTMVSVTITFQMVFMYYTGKQVSLKNFVKDMALLSVLNRIFECSFITVSTKDIQVNCNLVELFFLPHYQAGVLSKSHIYKGDIVSFYILESKRNGQCCAVELLLLEALPPVYVQGIVCSLKESFGFIDRADKVNEVKKLQSQWSVYQKVQ
ncbi:uncharacterized protein LOC124454663 isoform X2 [Xenia sp. Carnegie-2017]|uniref:uncharacterized protein LOC124454663 isoform X2 n=1 Tax=Xenia sp. Carnegie-2017 TaxID=2897299 RepID=UPI001F04A59F|nr:uncharacterized protein LOC124454663 isoform X2 [Xenia sp. Carnegie-2017]XP_046861396.1 uncharacterized protein LOC124454663 isoform X2 [Xenia sp. Carnegie-2017]